MNHCTSVFTNSCLRVPVDPISKMPKTAHERQQNRVSAQCSIDSSSVCSATAIDVDTERLKDFYKSIPDYHDINHLTEDDFYSTLKSLREKKTVMFGLAVNNINNSDDTFYRKYDNLIPSNESLAPTIPVKAGAMYIRRKHSKEEKELNDIEIDSLKILRNPNPGNNKTNTCLKRTTRKSSNTIYPSNTDKNFKITTMSSGVEKRELNSKRNHSACSISWNDANIQNKDEVDEKFKQIFDEKKFSRIGVTDSNEEFQTQSMPSSPLRFRKSFLPKRRTSITIPKPFKMTER